MSTVSAVAPAASAAVAQPSQRTARAALEAAGGFVLLGASAALGAGMLARVPSLAAATLLVPLGAWTVTGMSLLVVHQFLDLEAEPETVAAALVEGFVRTGRLAGSLAPVMLFFGATSHSRTAVGIGLLLLTGACGLPTTTALLRDAEPESDQRGFRLLLWAWLIFTTLVGLRIGEDLLS